MKSMKRHGRALLVVIGALSLVAIAAGSALAGKGLKTKSETVSVDAGENGSATATCKKGTKPVSGGFEAEFDEIGGPFFRIAESRRDGGREWTSAARNEGGEGGDLTSFAYCRDQKLKSRSATVEVEVDELDSATARCKRGEKAFSGGFASEGIDPGGPGFYPTESLKQGKRGWTASAYNAGSEERELTAYVHCREGKGVKTKQATETLGTNEFESVEASCRRKQRVVSGGFDTDSDFQTTDAWAMESRKLGKRGWEVAARGGFFGDPHDLVAYAYCEKKKTKKKG